MGGGAGERLGLGHWQRWRGGGAGQVSGRRAGKMEERSGIPGGARGGVAGGERRRGAGAAAAAGRCDSAMREADAAAAGREDSGLRGAEKSGIGRKEPRDRSNGGAG
jgi:hypothetical protein